MVDAEPERSGENRRDGQYEPTPPWVKVLLVVGVVLALAVLVMLLAGGDHGPGRHMGLAAVTDASR